MGKIVKVQSRHNKSNIPGTRITIPTMSRSKGDESRLLKTNAKHSVTSKSMFSQASSLSFNTMDER